jgi:hypothetical protein
MNDAGHGPEFAKLIEFLTLVPAISVNDTASKGIGSGQDADIWWVKFSIDITDNLAWNVVQEFGHVLNYLSTTEQLPTTFKPVSPPPYLNGGPQDYLSWVIECPVGDMSPDLVTEWLTGRLPRPVNDLTQWEI